MSTFFNADNNGSDKTYRYSNGSTTESLFSFYGPPSHASTSSTQSQFSPVNETRASLQRRFTTNNAPSVSTLSPIGQQRRQAAEYSAPDLGFAIRNYPGQRPDKKAAELEYIRQKRLQFENLQLEQAAQYQEAQNEIDRLKQEIRLREEKLAAFGRSIDGPAQNGHQSEPATQPPTPPEYRDSGFPTALSRPNRFSSSSLTSPPGLPAHLNRSDSHASSPPAERARAYQALTGSSNSGTHTTRNSDEEEDSYDEDIMGFNHRSAASLNRNSMPVTRRDHSVRNGISDFSSFGHVNTTRFLFGDEPEPTSNDATAAAAAKGTFLKMSLDDKGFPTLTGREGEGKAQVSNALDLASPVTGESVMPNNAFTRSAQSASNLSQAPGGFGESAHYSHPFSTNSSGTATPTKTSAANRHSMGPRIGTYSEVKRSGLVTPPDTNVPVPSTASSVAPKLQSSYSTNDIPTVKTVSQGPTTTASNANQSAEQRLHNHNMSLGRIPPGAIGSNRHSRDLSSSSSLGNERKNETQDGLFPSMQSILQNASGNNNANATSAPAVSAAETGAANPFSVGNQFNAGQFYNNYNGQTQIPNSLQGQMQSGLGGLAMLNTAMGNLNIAGQTPFSSPVSQAYGQSFSTNFFPQYGAGSNGRYGDSPSRGMQQRRATGSEDASRFANIELESLRGEIYGLCKDQHGCRFLQKKLEEHKPDHVQLIFDETNQQMVELMTDPFGNYLCQKLLEHTNDDQRTVLINNAAPHMVKIALNQHGTRALQKMIEYVSTPEQIHTVTYALKDQVVPMIQDLNGNHVIQKCLNHLSPGDAQFIFDAVAGHCVVVGTHRHGCCVIQRCIDHASGDQKAQLVAAITAASYPLVQDPFGNYVLQYIFDQNEASFSTPLCRTFLGNLAMLSKQKFSSNVIEKCIRIADEDTRRMMITEIINEPDFDHLADDAFANYVVQTAWDHATGEDVNRIADRVRPLLPRMRHKPYGRRFQSRIAEHDRRLGIEPGSMTPLEMSSPVAAPNQPGSVYQSPTHNNGAAGVNMMAYGSPPPYGGHANFQGPTYNSPQGHRLSNPPFPNFQSFSGYENVQHQFGSYSRGQNNGMKFY